MESQARKDLEEEGCPPCYPTDLEFPLQDAPDRYQEIMSYWQSIMGNQYEVLYAQLLDWKQFRQFQIRNRRHYLQLKTLSAFEDKIRERRQRHNVEGLVRLQPDLENQSRLADWIEFQDYHFQRHEEIAKEIEDSKAQLADAWKRTEVGDSANVKRAAQDVEAYQHKMEYAELRLGKHSILLQWIEQERIIMGAGHLRLVERDLDYEDGASRGVRRTLTRSHRKRQPKARSVLSPIQAGIWKPVPNKPNMQRQKHKLPNAEPVIVNLAIPQKSVSGILDGRETKCRSTKGKTALRPFRSQRVSKFKRSAEANTKVPSAPRLHKVRQKQLDQARRKQQKTSQPSYCTPMVVKTRCGRESRRPARWGFQISG